MRESGPAVAFAEKPLGRDQGGEEEEEGPVVPEAYFALSLVVGDEFVGEFFEGVVELFGGDEEAVGGLGEGLEEGEVSGSAAEFAVVVVDEKACGGGADGFAVAGGGDLGAVFAWFAGGEEGAAGGVDGGGEGDGGRFGVGGEAGDGGAIFDAGQGLAFGVAGGGGQVKFLTEGDAAAVEFEADLVFPFVLFVGEPEDGVAPEVEVAEAGLVAGAIPGPGFAGKGQGAAAAELERGDDGVALGGDGPESGGDFGLEAVDAGQRRQAVPEGGGG